MKPLKTNKAPELTTTSSLYKKTPYTQSIGLDKYLKDNGASFLHDKAYAFEEIGKQANIKPEVLVCIATADSSLGKRLKTAYNIGNVGNNDRGDTQSFSSIDSGIWAMAKTLNNKYLGHYTKIGELSRGGGNEHGSIYASSPGPWHKNVTACLSEITGEQVDGEWNFRI